MDIEKQGQAVNDINASDAAIEAELAEVLDGVTDSPNETAPETLAPAPVAEDRDRYARRLANMLTMPVVALFNVFAPAWKITTGEGERLTFAWSRVLAKYAPASWLYFVPDSNGAGGCVECDAVAVTLEVVAPRVIQARVEQEPPRKTKQEDTMQDVFEIQGQRHFTN